MHATLEALVEWMGAAIPETWRSWWVWLGIVFLLAAMIGLRPA